MHRSQLSIVRPCAPNSLFLCPVKRADAKVDGNITKTPVEYFQAAQLIRIMDFYSVEEKTKTFQGWETLQP